MRNACLATAVIVSVVGGITLAQGPSPSTSTAPAATARPLAQRIVRYDPSKNRTSQSVHAGAGPMAFGSMLGMDDTDTNLWFLHRGVIFPKGGIGGHFHNNCEEMFVILDGEAQFTIDGRTSVLKGPAGAPVRMGHWHAIYNHTDKPVEWMNINVTAIKGWYDAFDLGDARVNVPLDPVPPFMTMRLDRTLLRPVDALHGGKGEVQVRRALDVPVFLGPWGYVDHLLIPPGSSIGPSRNAEIGGFYYVLAGEGTVTVGSETAPIRAHEAVPIRFNETVAFAAPGSAALELMAIGVVKDAARRFEIVGRNPYLPARGTPPPR